MSTSSSCRSSRRSELPSRFPRWCRWMESSCSTSVPRTSLRLPAFGGNGKGRESPSRSAVQGDDSPGGEELRPHRHEQRKLARATEAGVPDDWFGARCRAAVRTLKSSLAVVGRDRAVQASFAPTLEKGPIPAVSQARPPESMRPDRPEVMTSVGQGQKIEIARGSSSRSRR